MDSGKPSWVRWDLSKTEASDIDLFDKNGNVGPLKALRAETISAIKEQCAAQAEKTCEK